MTTEYLSEKDVKEFCGFGRDLLRDLRTKGSNKGHKLPFYVINGRIRYKRTELVQFIDKHKID